MTTFDKAPETTAGEDRTLRSLMRILWDEKETVLIAGMAVGLAIVTLWMMRPGA